MEKINISCESIHSSDGYTYPVSSNVPHRYLWNADCEQAWKTNDGFLLADGSTFAQHDNPLASAVKPGNLTTLECVNGILYEITCHGFKYHFSAVYQVSNEFRWNKERSENNSNTAPRDRDHFCWLPAVLFFAILTFFICCIFRRHLHRVYERVRQILFRNMDEDTSGQLPQKKLSAEREEETCELNINVNDEI